jgi:hypothetical protein
VTPLKVCLVNCKRKGRNLLSARWKLPKGEVEINYRKLDLHLNSDDKQVEVAQTYFENIYWPDFQENELNAGLFGKHKNLKKSGKKIKR